MKTDFMQTAQLVMCGWCGVSYNSIYPFYVSDCKNGDGCAVGVFRCVGRTFAVGSYGSHKYDMQVYEIIDGDPEPSDSVCDDCLTARIRLGGVIYRGFVNQYVLPVDVTRN